jgi:hypothetical protein
MTKTLAAESTALSIAPVNSQSYTFNRGRAELEEDTSSNNTEPRVRGAPERPGTANATDQRTGVLAVQVKAPPVIAGTVTTVTLVVRNPFSDPVIIDSIEAPASAPLLPKRALGQAEAEASGKRGEAFGRPSFFGSIWRWASSIEVRELSVGPLVASFPAEQGREINVSLEPKSKFTVKSPFGPRDKVNISAKENSEVTFDIPEGSRTPDKPSRVIPAHQDDIASFEICTAHWLLVSPKVLDLYAVIRYRIGTAQRSQVVPFSIAIRPPLTAIICGGIAGGVLGYAAHQLTAANRSFELIPTAFGIAGVIVMAFILGIVLSRQENTKGFVTLEDFYGAFVVGVMLGYTGTGYFEEVLKSIGSSPPPSGSR